MHTGSVDVFVALLRAVNLAGHKPVRMSALVDAMGKVGLMNVFSLLQSGNLVFRSRLGTGGEIERLVERELPRRLGLQTDVFVRRADEWRKIVARNPFRDEAKRDPGHLVVHLLKDRPNLKRVDALRAAILGPEVVQADAKQLYAVYPAGIGRSRLTAALIEKQLGTRATGRNWNTVLKLTALVERVAQ